MGWLLIEAINVSAEVIAAIFGIAVTVVAIIVQLAATRYNHQITTMFIRGPINIGFLSFFVGVTLMCIWVAAYPHQSELVHTLALWLVTAALLVLLPYFGYVFTFISPLNIIQRVSTQAYTALRKQDSQAANEAVNQLQDIARSAIDQGDRTIALAVCEALRELFDHYRESRDKLNDAWFDAAKLEQDSDFISFEAGARENLLASGQWFEAKLLHQFLNIIWLATPNMRDVASSVGIATQKIAITHIQDQALFDLCSRAMNSLLRACINSRDARTTYHLLSQYRTMAEAALDAGHQKAVHRVAVHIGAYGKIAYEDNQYFILEVAAFDLARLIEHAHVTLPEALQPLLATFLGLDQEIRVEAQEPTLEGVRRAQIQVATYLLQHQEHDHVEAIVTDLKTEDATRLARIIAELQAETEDMYWEFTPRGVNFSYLSEELRAQLPILNDHLAPSPE